MKSKILVLGFSGYDFNDSDGKRLSGAKLYYLMSNSIVDDLKMGILPCNSKMSLEKCRNLNNGVFPFFADAIMDFIPDSKGNPSLTIVDIVPVRNLDVKELFK